MQEDIEIQESSTPVESPTTPAVESSTPSTPAEASDSSGESKESLLDAVLKVVEPTAQDAKEDGSETKEEAPTSKEPSNEDQPEEGDETHTETEGDDPEDTAAIKDANRQSKRYIRKLQRQRKELQEQVQQFERLLPSAELGQQFQNYAQANQLSSQDVVMALDLAGMVSRGDWQGFYNVISPLVREAQERVGVVLPTDIQSRVDQGHMTSQAARELADERFRRAQYEQQTQVMQQHQQTAMLHQVKDEVQRAVSDFEQRISASDPDYKVLADQVRRVAQARLFERGGQISSAQEAIEITKGAWEEVKAHSRRLQPAPRATAPIPGGSNHQAPQARTAPKSLMEAALQGLANSKRAG